MAEVAKGYVSVCSGRILRIIPGRMRSLPLSLAVSAFHSLPVARSCIYIHAPELLHTTAAFGVGGFINDMIKESFEDEEEAMFMHMPK